MKMDRTPIAQQRDREVAPIELKPEDWLRIANEDRDARRRDDRMRDNAALFEAVLTPVTIVLVVILLASMLFSAIPVFIHQAQQAPAAQAVR